MVMTGALVVSVVIVGAFMVAYGQHWRHFYSFYLLFILLACFKLYLFFSHEYVGPQLSLLLVHG